MAVSFRLRLIRHGQTAGNVRGVVDSHTSTPLNDVGRRQADALGASWRSEGATFRLALSSDTTRALETCRRVLSAAGLTSLDPRPEAILREREGGSLEGLPMEEARRLQQEAKVTGRVIPGLETPLEAQQRAGRFFMKLVEEMVEMSAHDCSGSDGGDGGSQDQLPEVVVFTHRGLLYCLIVYLQTHHDLRLPAELLPLGELHCSWNTAQTRLLVTRGEGGEVTVRCEYLYRDEHLTGELAQTDYILPGGVHVPRH